VNWLNAYIVSGLISAARHVSTIVDDNSRFVQRNAFMRDRRRVRERSSYGSEVQKFESNGESIPSQQTWRREFFFVRVISRAKRRIRIWMYNVRMNNVRLSRATLSSNQKTRIIFV